MPKPVLTDSRYDFRGGRVTAVSPDLLNANELVDCTNAEISDQYGSVTKREGYIFLDNEVPLLETYTAINYGISGLIQWDAPGVSGKQIVAISGKNLYYKNGDPTAAVNFSNEGSDLFNLGYPVFFAPFREASAGAPLVLYIACGGDMFKWDGAALTQIDGVANAPTSDMIIAYHTRMFAHQLDKPKHIYWSKVGDAEIYTTGTKTDGGSALVDVLNGEAIKTLEVIGSSLLLASEDSVSRFTGHASDDIVIAQDTEGISSEVGAAGAYCLKRYENFAAMLSDRGMYDVSEIGVRPISEQVSPDFDAADKRYLSYSCIGWDRRKKLLMVALAKAPAATFAQPGADTIYAYSPRLQTWTGPWTYTSLDGITCLARIELIDGTEGIMAGVNTGAVVQLNTGLDDGDEDINMVVEIPTIVFGKPGTVKSIFTLSLHATIPVGRTLQVKHSFDGAAFVTHNIAGVASTARHYRVDVNNQGYRLRLQFLTGNNGAVAAPIVYGYTLNAYDYNRP